MCVWFAGYLFLPPLPASGAAREGGTGILSSRVDGGNVSSGNWQCMSAQCVARNNRRVCVYWVTGLAPACMYALCACLARNAPHCPRRVW